jgi:hypothetical protein
MQGAHQVLEIQIGFFHDQVILPSLRPVGDTGKVDVQMSHGIVTKRLAINIQRRDPLIVSVHGTVAQAGMQVGKVDAREDPRNSPGHFKHIRNGAEYGSLSTDLRAQGDRVAGRAQLLVNGIPQFMGVHEMTIDIFVLANLIPQSTIIKSLFPAAFKSLNNRSNLL